MNKNARMTHSQDSASRSMTLPTSGFALAATGSVSSAFIWHHLNFPLNDYGGRFFGLRRASFELALRSVHRIHAGVARRAERSARIVHRAPQILERDEAQRIRAEILANFLDRALRPVGAGPAPIGSGLARVEPGFKRFEFLGREPRAHPRFIGRD